MTTSTRDRRLPCFKAYDIRGRVPEELNEAMAYRVGQAFVELRRPDRMVVGRDVRLSSRMLSDALVEGITSKGVDVVDIGLCGTEMMYFATAHLEGAGVEGGIMVTASHNPSDYNGMKIVGQGARPVHGGNGLAEIEALVADGYLATGPSPRGHVKRPFIMPEYVEHLLGYVDTSALSGMTIVTNPGNGGAGLVVDALEKQMPVRFVKLHHEPDGRFPHGVPNPLLPGNRSATADAVRVAGADLGVAWDGDFDRCFLFDETGAFIEGYYVVGLLAEEMLRREPGAKIIYEPRLTWNTIEMVQRAGGQPVLSRTGHAYIKDSMRTHDAAYGGEMSAHHYFRDFAYCDSGMIPWLLVAALMRRTGKRLSQLVAERQARFPCSGEINREVSDVQRTLDRVQLQYAADALAVDTTDGLSFEFEDWRFNLRPSNTEPVIRLNVESRGDTALMQRKTEEILRLVDAT